MENDETLCEMNHTTQFLVDTTITKNFESEESDDLFPIWKQYTDETPFALTRPATLEVLNKTGEWICEFRFQFDRKTTKWTAIYEYFDQTNKQYRKLPTSIEIIENFKYFDLVTTKHGFKAIRLWKLDRMYKSITYGTMKGGKILRWKMDGAERLRNETFPVEPIDVKSTRRYKSRKD